MCEKLPKNMKFVAPGGTSFFGLGVPRTAHVRYSYAF